MLQYRAAFRRNAGAAKVVATLLALGSGLWLYVTGVVTLLSAAWEDLSWTTFSLLAGMYGFGILGILCSRDNRQWARTLQAWEATQPDRVPERPFQFLLRELLVWTAILAVGTSLTSCFLRALQGG